MKHLPIENIIYKEYIVNFGTWLRSLGYSKHSYTHHPARIQEFFYYLEMQGIGSLMDLKKEPIQAYIHYLQTRKHYTLAGGLSVTHINSHIGVLVKFASYLRLMVGIHFPVIPKRLKAEKKYQTVVFTQEEIQHIFACTDDSLLGIRDRAMLTVYYGCGVRLSEGVRLEVSDVLFDKKLLRIRTAKNGHERYVPVTTKGLSYLEAYINQSRNLLENENGEEKRLFIGSWGTKTPAHMLYKRLILLYKRAGIDKKAGTHTLRHSIATHLLQKGMELEKIALLLGHRCLDSTQMYTHLVMEERNYRL